MNACWRYEFQNDLLFALSSFCNLVNSWLEAQRQTILHYWLNTKRYISKTNISLRIIIYNLGRIRDTKAIKGNGCSSNVTHIVFCAVWPFIISPDGSCYWWDRARMSENKISSAMRMFTQRLCPIPGRSTNGWWYTKECFFDPRYRTNPGTMNALRMLSLSQLASICSEVRNGADQTLFRYESDQGN